MWVCAGLSQAPCGCGWGLGLGPGFWALIHSSLYYLVELVTRPLHLVIKWSSCSLVQSRRQSFHPFTLPSSTVAGLTRGEVLPTGNGASRSPGMMRQRRRQRHQHHHHNNNNNTIWRVSVFTGEEPPLHSGEIESCSPPSRRPNPIPAIPPCVVRTPHLHGASTTEETVELCN